MKEEKGRYKEKKCIVCEKDYFTRKKVGRGRIYPARLRPINSLTCSKKCSKVYEYNREKYAHKIKDKKEVKNEK